MSLREMICMLFSDCVLSSPAIVLVSPYVFVSQVFEEFELAVCSLRKDRGTEWLHDLLDSHRLAGELVFGRTGNRSG